MNNNPYNIFCISFICALILFISVLISKWNKEKNRHYNIILWSGVVVYTALLPYTILAFQFIYGLLPGYLISKIPVTMASLLCLTFYFVSRKQKNFFHLHNIIAIVTGIAIYACIFYFQKLPNKQIHVSQYFVLSYLISRASKFSYNGKCSLFIVWFCASLTGFLDESFQGIHNGRYFSLNDVFMDSAASFAAVLFFSTAKDMESTNSDKNSHFVFSLSYIKDIYTEILKNNWFYITSGSIICLVTVINTTIMQKNYMKSGTYGPYPVALSIFSITAIAFLSSKFIINRQKVLKSTGRLMFLLVSSIVLLVVNLNSLALISFKIEFK